MSTNNCIQKECPIAEEHRRLVTKLHYLRAAIRLLPVADRESLKREVARTKTLERSTRKKLHLVEVAPRHWTLRADAKFPRARLREAA